MMAAPTSNSSLARSRTLRSNTLGSLKPHSTALPQTAVGPSNISLFLTNLRLLDLDLRDDWPDITALSLSSKDAKKRIQDVEWALYQLFEIWDPDDARYKLQPFFPPLEPLQSLNLRAALFRCLEQAKKAGALGRDTTLRKTMLDECKGERMEEVLAVFSNAVLKKVLQESESESHKAIARVLALENFSYSGERTVLSSLIMAHKAILRKHLREKNGLRAQYSDFNDLLKLNERRIARRHEQLKQVIDERDGHNTMAVRELRELQERVQNNWSGGAEWLEAIFYGDSRIKTEGVLGTSFNEIWSHVEDARIGELERTRHVGLLEQLKARVQEQDTRLARWKDFRKRVCKDGHVSPVKAQAVALAKQKKKIDLGFNRHQSLQIGRSDAEKGVSTSSSLSLEEYTRLVENMQAELADVGKLRSPPRVARQSSTFLSRDSIMESPRPQQETLQKDLPRVSPHPRQESPIPDEEWSSASDSDEADLEAEQSSVPHTSLSAVLLDYPQQATKDFSTRRQKTNISISTSNGSEHIINQPPLVKSHAQTQPQAPPHAATPPTDLTRDAPQGYAESELADQILNSVTAASPSPKKPRHTLSLAERTRLTMSRASHSKYSDLHYDLDSVPDLPEPRASKEATKERETEKHAELIERTRKSMAGFEAAQQKAQIARRRSMKDARKKQRESSYFPKVEEEPATTPGIDAAEMIQGDPDYEDVFKSRPKIKTSPAASPNRMRIWEDEGEA